MKLRQFIMKYSSEKAKMRKDKIGKLEVEIRDLENQMLDTPPKMISDEIDRKKKELEKLYDYARQGLRCDLEHHGLKKGKRMESILISF